MKSYLSVILSLIFFALSNAQQNPDSTIVHSLRSGSWAIQFGVSSNFTLQTFNGTTISLKRHSTPNSAWRYGISLGGETEDRDSKQKDGLPSAEIINDQRNQFNFNVSMQYLYYPNPNKNIKLFLGTGPVLGFSHYYMNMVSDLLIEDTLYSKTDRDRKSKNISLGLAISTGIEYFIPPYISLHAEYRSSLLYIKSWADTKEKVDYTNNDLEDRDTHKKEEYNRFSLSSNYVLFGLSAYF